MPKVLEFLGVSGAVLIGILVLIGGAIAAIQTVANSVSRAIPQCIQNVKSACSYCNDKIKLSPSIAKQRLIDKMLPIIGHEEEKGKILNMILGWIESKCNPTLKKKTGGLVLYVVGPSGTGKSMVADAVAHALLGDRAKPVTVSLSSVDTASKLSIAEQLFGTREEVANGNLKIKKDSPLLNQIKRNPKTVIVINEYDKLQNIDGTLDNCLWDIADSGVIDINGVKVDCSEIIIIATSNEASACIGVPDAFEDDGSLTTVTHSKAFLNRIKPIIFSGLTRENYSIILRNLLAKVQADYLKRYRLQVEISEATIQRMTDDILAANRGAREVNTYINNIYAQLVDYRITNKISDKTASSRKAITTIKVLYNSGNHSFTVVK